MNLPKRSEDREELNRVITELLDAGHNKVVLDLSPVTGYCTPAGLSELMWALRTMHQRKGQLKLSNVPPSVRAGLELSHLLKVFGHPRRRSERHLILQIHLTSRRSGFCSLDVSLDAREMTTLKFR